MSRPVDLHFSNEEIQAKMNEVRRDLESSERPALTPPMLRTIALNLLKRSNKGRVMTCASVDAARCPEDWNRPFTQLLKNV